jgi:hypothetical protein
MEGQAPRFPIRRMPSFAAAKAEEYRYWGSRHCHERMDAVTELTAEAYNRRDPQAHVSRLRTTAVLLKR